MSPSPVTGTGLPVSETTPPDALDTHADLRPWDLDDGGAITTAWVAASWLRRDGMPILSNDLAELAAMHEQLTAERWGLA